MTALRLALFVALLPFASFAQADVLLVSPSADYAANNTVPDNIKNECKLPAAQTESVVAALNAAGITAQAAPSAAVPAKGRFLKLEITGAVSAGNAFMGHQKQVTTAAHLFVNGKEVAQTSKTRDSMGGVFAGYRGSCSVLHRCTNVLGKDIADWVKSQPGS
jgi:hypothetical protein